MRVGWMEELVGNEVKLEPKLVGSSQAGEQELKVVARPELEDANACRWCLLEKM